MTEAALLGLVAIAIVVGQPSLGMTRTGTFSLWEPGPVAIYLGALLVAHLAQVLAGRRSDQVLLPAMAMLGGISLLLMLRLPQELADAPARRPRARPGRGPARLAAPRPRDRDDARRSSCAPTAGCAATSTPGRPPGSPCCSSSSSSAPRSAAQRLTLRLGPLSGQPSELLKVILVVFLAGYLSENRPLLIEQDTRVGPFRLPPLPYLAPMVAMWAIALGIVVVQRDLGAALLFFGVFLALLYAATGRVSLVVIGLVLFFAGSAVLATLVRPRPHADRYLARPVRRPARRRLPDRPVACTPSPGAAWSGWGSATGCRSSTAGLPIPEVHTDFPLAALGEELGLIGVVAILGLYLVIVQRGLRIGAAAADDFRAILATGLALVIGFQAFIIAAGNLKVLPLTGVTLPFISYGGSSMLVNAVVVGLLLALSDKGVEPPPPPTAPAGWRAARSAGAAAADARDRRDAAARSAGTIVHVALVLRSRSASWPARPATGPVDRGAGARRARRTTPRSSPARGPCARGKILDRDGMVLASNAKTDNGEPYRVYAGRAISQVVGYASRRYGTAGLELAYDAELAGLAGDPVAEAFRKFGTDPYDPQDLTLSLSCDLQQAAVKALGDDRGRRRDARPDDRRGPRARLDADVRRLGDRRPGHGRRGVRRPSATTRPSRSCRGRRRAATCPGSVFKIVTAIAGLGSGAVEPATTYEQQPAAEEDGLARQRLPDPRRPPPVHRRPRARLRRGDRGLVQHLVRADRSRHRRQGPRRLRRADGVRCAAPVRPADGRVAGHQWQRQRSRAASSTTSSSPTPRTARPRPS